ncbi:alpha/beta hydrolase [Serinibacter arcticus]|uniref:Alpha/beta hydrolase n=1 Tax=Serinibacter arcticus TaxID=1655435 RepID=A0A2U1ZYK1_9MICO|nr:alpha/beta hydrolase [Serinibacter arcticus]PWD52003.1 alpha/beta hydrolase [Serinibacter arcticus]
MIARRRVPGWVARTVGRIDDYRHILAIQLRAWLRPDPPPSFATGDGVPVLILPGIYEPWQSLERLARALNEAGHPVVVVPELGRNLGALRTSARVVARRLRASGTDRLVIVAHSKGGLIGKALMLGPIGHRVLGMVAISTPFGGSRHARWFPDPTVRLLSDLDPHLGSLRARHEVDPRIVSVYASFDPHIPGGSALAGAENVVVDVVGHFRVVDHPQVRRATLDAVARFAAGPTRGV